MWNILENDNSFYTEQWFEINEVNETISIKNIINGQFNKWKTFVLDSISNIMNLFKKTEVKPINKEDLLTVSPEEFKRWKNTPHNIIDTRVNSDWTITLDYLNEVSTSNEGKPYWI